VSHHRSFVIIYLEILQRCVTGAERQNAELLAEVEKLKEAIEYEKQPNIVFEKENKQLQDEVCEVRIFSNEMYGKVSRIISIFLSQRHS